MVVVGIAAVIAEEFVGQGEEAEQEEPLSRKVARYVSSPHKCTSRASSSHEDDDVDGTLELVSAAAAGSGGQSADEKNESGTDDNGTKRSFRNGRPSEKRTPNISSGGSDDVEAGEEVSSTGKSLMKRSHRADESDDDDAV